MKIIAVDDEKIALQGLLSAIQQAAPNAEIHGFRYTREAIEHMEKDPCDVAFLDIEMKGMNGVQNPVTSTKIGFESILKALFLCLQHRKF